MASVSTLLELTPLQWNQPLPHMQRPRNRSVLLYSKPQRRSNSIRFQISVKFKKSTSSDPVLSSDSKPFEQIVVQVKRALDSLKKPAIAAVLLGLLLFYDPNTALAASGGRIGGNSFSSRSRSSSSSSQSYSVPRTSNPSFSYSARTAPYYGPSPFGGGLMGPAVGFGFGGFSSFSLILVGFAAFVLVSGFLSDRSQDDSILTDTQKTSVIKLQVKHLALQVMISP